jgi:ribonuclease HI
VVLKVSMKQDCLINQEARARAIEAGDECGGRKRGVVDLQIHWVPGHLDFEPNEHADEKAKKVALRDSSDTKFLPAFLQKCLPSKQS